MSSKYQPDNVELSELLAQSAWVQGLARKLVREELPTRGAIACVGLFTLDEFRAEVADLAIEVTAA